MEDAFCLTSSFEKGALMLPQGITSQLLLMLLASVCGSVFNIANSAKADESVETSSQIRVGTVDFILGEHTGKCGCPSVMSRNRKTQMVLVMSSQVDDQVGNLLTTLNTNIVDGENAKGHFVYLPTRSHRSAEQQAMIVARLHEFAKEHEAANFNLSVRRAAKNKIYDLNEIDSATVHSVYLFIDGVGMKHWMFQADELSDEKIAAIKLTAMSSFEDRHASDGK